MTLVSLKYTPKIHCIMVDEDGLDCSWVFPELDNKPEQYMVALDLLVKDIERGDLVPVHINPDFC